MRDSHWAKCSKCKTQGDRGRIIYKGRPQMGICLFLGALCRKIFSFGILYSMWLSCSQKDMNLGNLMCEKFKPSSVWNALSTLKDKQEKGDFKKWGTAVGTMLICWGWDAFLSYPLWSTARQGYKKFPSNRFVLISVQYLVTAMAARVLGIKFRRI